MDNFIAVMTWDANGRVTKYQGYTTAEEAQAHVDKFMDRFPDAFVASNPGGSFATWRHNSGALLFDPPPPPTPAQVAAALREKDSQQLIAMTADMNLLLVRLIQRIMAVQPAVLAPSNFTVAVRQAYVDAKAVADKLDPGGA